jgi:sialic acid synthase SpsE
LKNFIINRRKVGKDTPCFIIAEAGSNHNGKLKQAKKLIDDAKAAGADAVKFQLFKAGNLSADKKSQCLLKQFEFKREWIEELNKYSQEKNIIFLATPFDKEAVDLLDKINVPAFKIASGDLTDLPLIRYIAKKGKPIILSVGLGSLKEIREALDTIYSTGNKEVAILHCVVDYPTKPEDVNLNIINTLKQFNIPVGFSDHTMEISIPIAAIALGASIIEKHFTTDRKLKGPDHNYALEPNELKEMIHGIRTVEKSFGSEKKQIIKSERKNFIDARRSIHARRNIPKGTIITEDMIKVVRPATGIEPKYIDQVLNKKTKKEIKENNAIKWDDLFR